MREYLIDKISRWASRQTAQTLLCLLRCIRNIDAGAVAVPDDLDRDELAQLGYTI